MKIPCRLIKASLNYSSFHFFFAVFSGCGRWDLDMKWNYCSYQCKMAKLPQTKAICLYSAGNCESSLIIPWLELISGPCLSLSPWEPDTMYYRALRILNTYSNPWCRLLIDLHVRWRTEAQNTHGSASLMWKKQVKAGFHCIILYSPQYYTFCCIVWFLLHFPTEY